MIKAIKVYAKVNESNIITEINSEIFLEKINGYTLIDEGVGDKFSHAQNNYLPNGLIDSKGKYNYKFENGKLVLITDEEKELLFPRQPEIPSFEEQQTDFNIDVDYRLSCIELGIM